MNEVIHGASTSFDMIGLDLIAPSLTNPRKHFDEVKLQDLAESIRTSGVHQPILVRPLPGERLEDTRATAKAQGAELPIYEIVAGERRFRASRMAKAGSIPAMIRVLDDAQVLEIQIVENLQRDDLTDLEEAEGYQCLCDATGIDKSEIGSRIGRSRSYVYARLKLLDLCSEAKDALRAGHLDSSKAVLIARIPDHKLQIKALKEFTEKNHLNEDRLSYRGAVEWIRNNVMLKLADARFKISDASLLAEAGSCDGCQKRTDANPDLFNDLDSQAICIDPKCFHQKEDAHTANLIEQQRKKGFEVIDGKEAKEVMPSPYLSNLAGYTSIDTKLLDDDGDSSNETSLRDSLTKEERKSIKVLVNPYTSELVHVIPKELAKQIEKRVFGEQKKDAKPRAIQIRDLEIDIEKKWRMYAIQELKPRIPELNAFSEPMLRLMLTFVLMQWSSYDSIDFGMVLGDFCPADPRDDEQLKQAVRMIDGYQLGHMICLALAIDSVSPERIFEGNSWSVNKSAPFIEVLAESLKVDLEPIKKMAKDELAPEVKSKKSEKSASAKRPAARGEANAKNADAKKTAAQSAAKGAFQKVAKAKKISAKEAQDGIAKALQKTEEVAQ
jgi:ParB/RepB/Spo0J family partition protein